MFGKILYMSNSEAHVEINKQNMTTNIMNMHVIFEDASKKIVGEVIDISNNTIKISLLGEITDNKFYNGVIRKPSIDSIVRIISKDELECLLGTKTPNTFQIGFSPLYDNYPISIDVNSLFSNHLAIFGNSGSGKSCGVARIIQNLFMDPNIKPYKSNFFIFDAYGEYHNAFKNINQINPNYNFKYYTTNKSDIGGEPLKIPLWLLDQDDLAILLNVTKHSQLPIIEKMLKIVSIFSTDDKVSNVYKNHLIAKAIMTVLYTNETSSAKRNDAFSILASCTTNEFNLEAPVQGIGYIRKFRECFSIDSNGNFSESILLTEYLSKFIKDELDNVEIEKANYYTLEDLEKALNFTLISEGLLRNGESYADAIALKVRLHSIIISKYHEYFNMQQYMTRENYIASLVTKDNRKAQIVNFNMEDVDDWFGKFVTKTITKLVFEFSKNLNNRATIPFHLFLEEAHRYVQNDTDSFLLGYNIFERVAKEGRKYGVMLNLISQRPVELSDTVISQVSNFIIFKLNHPKDLEYVKTMLPNISADIVDKQKTLQPGTCVAFGQGVRVPLLITMEMPNPAPFSNNCDVINSWTIKQ